jgi:hypothetical protein
VAGFYCGGFVLEGHEVRTVPGFAAEASLYRGRGYYGRMWHRPPGGVHTAQEFDWNAFMDRVPLRCPGGMREICHEERICLGEEVPQCLGWDWQPFDSSNPALGGRRICTEIVMVCDGPETVSQVCECVPFFPRSYPNGSPLGGLPVRRDVDRDVERRERLAAADQVGGFLGEHDRGRVQVARDDARHDRRVDHA